jgi:hypothetical protein
MQSWTGPHRRAGHSGPVMEYQHLGVGHTGPHAEPPEDWDREDEDDEESQEDHATEDAQRVVSICLLGAALGGT